MDEDELIGVTIHLLEIKIIKKSFSVIKSTIEKNKGDSILFLGQKYCLWLQ